MDDRRLAAEEEAADDRVACAPRFVTLITTLPERFHEQVRTALEVADRLRVEDLARRRVDDLNLLAPALVVPVHGVERDLVRLGRR